MFEESEPYVSAKYEDCFYPPGSIQSETLFEIWLCEQLGNRRKILNLLNLKIIIHRNFSPRWETFAEGQVNFFS